MRYFPPKCFCGAAPRLPAPGPDTVESASMRIAYLDCFSGISGDMLLGAMIDAGVPLSVFTETVTALNVGARIEAHKVVRGGLTATKADVITGDEPAAEEAHAHTHDHVHGHDHEHAHSHPHSHSHDHDHEHPHPHTREHDRSLSTILGIIRSAPLPDGIKQRASEAFQLLGEAEAGI